MSEVIGFVCCFIAIFCFGTSFVPVKKHEAGDGMFYQWVMCITIWLAGLLVQLIQGAPQFEPLAMIGGVLWATGNCLCVPVMRFIGIGLGMLIWSTTNLVMGWAAGRFGFFGIDKQEDIAIPALNYVGVLVCVASIGIFFFVKTSLHDEKPQEPISSDTPKSGVYSYSTLSEDPEAHGTPIVMTDPSSNGNSKQVQNPLVRIAELQNQLSALQGASDFGALDQLPERSKQVLGFAGGIAAGLVFGLNFVAPQYLIDHPESFGRHHSSQGLDYVFSHFTGILLASTFWFFLYCAIKRNRPSVYPQVILPGAASGLLWAAAQICWFVANGSLSFVITYPLISSGPGLVASLCGVFLFGEIRGKRNYILLVSAGAVAILGAILITLSKVGV